MAAKAAQEEEQRRIAAFEATKSPQHPSGCVSKAALAVGIKMNAMSKFLRDRGIKTDRKPLRSRQECLDAFQQYVARHKKVPSRNEFVLNSHIGHKWRTFWPNWADFLEDAGVIGDSTKILILDIETAPNLAYVWGTWKQNINPEWIAANGYVLCWTAKWLGEDSVTFRRLHKDKPLMLLEPIHRMLSEAHAVIHYNGKKFDIPTLNKEFLLHKMTPPSPYKQIDLLRTMWDTFLFPANKLDYIAQTLEIGEKLRHEGPELWLKCMNDDKSAWEKMELYNKRDVELTEGLYMRLRPWIKGHPNRGAIEGLPICPTCGSYDYKRDGEHLAQILKYARFQCDGCGTWFRGSRAVNRANRERFVAAA